MNKTEDKLLIRLYSVNTDIPLPINGANWNKSANASGFISYGKDMAALKPTLQSALYHIRIGEYEEADHELTLAERYIELRKSQKWESVESHPTITVIEQ